MAIDVLDGPVVLVGHSYDGVVISEAGNHPKVAALVYIAAFVPDKGESVSSLIADPALRCRRSCRPRTVSCSWTARSSRTPSPDVPVELAEFMADSQVPWGVDAPIGAVAEPAWRVKPSWYLVATHDRMIPPPAQRAMSERAGSQVVEVPGSHAVYVSRPDEVAALIKRAAGLSVGPAGATGLASLAPQQREIAMLAAAGLTSKQIGERLPLPAHRLHPPAPALPQAGRGLPRRTARRVGGRRRLTTAVGRSRR
nr:alpha/beta fold hydrolase [Streptomyces sp. Ag109_O5-1]